LLRGEYKRTGIIKIGVLDDDHLKFDNIEKDNKPKKKKKEKAATNSEGE